MDATSLRAAQAPLKQSYKQDPTAAQVTLTSTSTLDAGLSCSLGVGQAIRKAGLHKMAGGVDPSQLCSGDMLLESLVACTGVTLRAVATAMSIPLSSGTVTAEGDLDFRGTLGVDKTVPVGFTAIRLKFDLDCGGEEVTPKDKVEKLIEMTERYCVVLQTLKNGVPRESSLV
ncbi:OsmC family protein [Leucosporidium creatinivorum]|uniref:OsmC family protein n=1 Tax=Leucosporidium creatinivorum TaxID=106004 RepID=A0A1Y2DX31_9BASI|nr:OsmC family protein [Leucosporidium creatinivorum]